MMIEPAKWLGGPIMAHLVARHFMELPVWDDVLRTHGALRSCFFFLSGFSELAGPS